MFLLLFLLKGGNIMHQEFIIQTLETSLIDKKIIVTANMDINPNSKDEIHAELYNRETKEAIFTITEIKGNVVEFTLMDWPTPNTPYIFYLKNLKNILNEVSRSGIKRKIEFKSTITKEVKITSPAMHEAVKSLNLKWDIVNNTTIEDNNENDYVYIEIATDNEFANVVNSTKIHDKNEVSLMLRQSAQYFVRARVENNNKELQYGKWSNIVSFVYGEQIVEDIKEECPDYIPEYDDMLGDMCPEIDDIAEFSITCLMEQGTTPKEIVLMANKPLDEDNFERSQVMVYTKRGLVKYNTVITGEMIILEFPEGLKDNTVYTMKLMNIKSLSGDVISSEFTFTTAMKPLYCEVYQVTSLIGEHKIPDDVILHHIHEASKFADYIASCADEPYIIDEDNVPFQVIQFVKYYAAHECLLRHTVDISSSVGLSGTVGNVQFSEKESVQDVTKLLKHFCDEIAKWKDELRGFQLEGRARMRTAIRGVYANPATQPMNINGTLTYGRGDLYGQ